jgi:8-oxo-dGTP pyrophosphatase MutT (NUDIX family)
MVVARPAADGIEVLMLRRSATSTFGAGFVVFPGGSIEPQDSALGERWFGSEDEAPRACAIRELAEEAAVVTTGDGLRPLDPSEHPIDVISRDPPRLSDIPQLSRWIAPEFLQVRFDAHFFAVAAPPDLEARPDELEADRAWWASPSAVLGEHGLWESLMWPTFATLRELERCSTVRDVLALRMDQVAPPVKGP